MTYLTIGAGTSKRAGLPTHSLPVEVGSGDYVVAPLTAYVLRVVISGFWTPSMMKNFTRDAALAVRALACAPEEHMVLCDISAAAIQSQPVFAAFRALLVDGPQRALKIAFVSNNPISRMQARRLMAARANVELFETEGSALAWLTAVA